MKSAVTIPCRKNTIMIPAVPRKLFGSADCIRGTDRWCLNQLIRTLFFDDDVDVNVAVDIKVDVDCRC